MIVRLFILLIVKKSGLTILLEMNRLSLSLLIDIFPIANSDDGDCEFSVLYLIDDSVVANPDAIGVTSF